MIPSSTSQPPTLASAKVAAYTWPLRLNVPVLLLLLMALVGPQAGELWWLGFIMASGSLNCLGLLLMLFWGKERIAVWFGVALLAMLAVGFLAEGALPPTNPGAEF
jgi:hypothetical protein